MEPLNQCLNSFERTAQRIETLPKYNITEENKRFYNYSTGNIED